MDWSRGCVGSAEPALALAAGVKPEDELLLASEAATLKLQCGLGLLSACNTASPMRRSAASRPFACVLFAGANSLLVSHCGFAMMSLQLIPAMLLAQRQHPGLSGQKHSGKLR